ncbi:MAG: hypothetical protein ACE5PT_15070, partial [Gemmatimonadales bacterium]
MDPAYEKRRYAAQPRAAVEVRQRGPVRAVVRVTRRFRGSTFVQDVAG